MTVDDVTGSDAAAHWGSGHGMRILVVGTGCSHATQSRSTSFVIEHDGYLLGIDCPHPAHHSIADAARIAGVDVCADDIDTWHITHIHADHASGLESVAYHNWFAHRRPTNVAAHPDVGRPLRNMHIHSALGNATDLDGNPKPLDLDHIWQTIDTRDDEPTRIGPFTIDTHRVRHTVPCYAVRVSVDGVTFAYSADTTCDADMLAWMTGADLSAYDTAGGAIHSSLEQLTEHVDPSLRSRSMLVHRCDFDDTMTAAGIHAGFQLPADGTLHHLTRNR